MYQVFRAALLALALSLLATAPAQAQDKSAPAAPQAAPTATEAPQKKTETAPAKKAAITVEHDDADPLGARLAYRLKELLGRSALMQLTNKDEKKIVIVLKTKEEFPGRPNLCSIYSVSWLFSSREGALKYYLTSEAGIVDAAGVDQTAEMLLGKTDKLANTYGYLF
ncbi:MAG: hypothetical protein AB9872_08275 [Solidesulfovibrio sp.]